jgi:hypothetical protein
VAAIPPASDPEPVSLDDSLAALQRYLGTARPDGVTTLRAHWRSLVGDRFAGHCTLHSIRHGCLVVATSDPGVAEQLRWSAGDLAAAANAVLGRRELSSVEVRVATVEGG